jgi:hypothetical protein
MHDFTTSLAASHAVSDAPFWSEIYAKAFPGGVMVDHRQDGEHQRVGVDRSIIMPNSKQILVDEKARFTDYGDILVEYWSDEARRIPGWVCKPLRCDFIAYAIVPRGWCYLLPVLPLQSAWQRHGQKWIEQYKRIEAKNRGYITVSVGVPIQDLFSAIGQALRVQFNVAEVAA